MHKMGTQVDAAIDRVNAAKAQGERGVWLGIADVRV